ncbi:hypothetical protein MJO29_009006 [Puccinia striiformis f. sp. tritici]|nr:hypothetical protein MJO29_009006 [Puccinia striiformis f. sp. tritici]
MQNRLSKTLGLSAKQLLLKNSKHSTSNSTGIENQGKNNQASRNYVTQSKNSLANILSGPVHPLSPPEPPLTTTPNIPLSVSIDSAPKLKQKDGKKATKPIEVAGVTIKHNHESKILKIKSKTLETYNLEIPYLWLRDSCQESHSIDPRTKQKLFKTSDIPLDIHPIKTTIIDHPSTGPELIIQWSHPLLNRQNRDPPSKYKINTFFKDLDNPDHVWERKRHKLELLKPVYWSDNKKVIPPTVPSSSKDNQMITIKNKIEELKHSGQLFIDYQKFKSDKQIQKSGIERLNKLGLIFFENLDDNEFELSNLIETLGVDIRRTFYGDLWDVISTGNQAKNIANTNLELDYHMDLLHFENPPRFQFLHCIKNEVEGGCSGFLDSYSVVKQLLLTDPDSFRRLCTVMVGYEYINDNHHTFHKHPIIELKPKISIDRLLRRPHELLDHLVAVNYSPPFQAPFALSENNRHSYDFSVFVKSLQRFTNLFQNHHKYLKFDFHVRLDKGQAVAFDNRRILHARTAFESKPSHLQNSSSSKDGHVHRWLKGAYVDGDSVWDRIRVLNS